MWEFLSARIGGIPVIFIVIAGGVVVALFAPKLLGKVTGGGSSAQTNLGGTTQAAYGASVSNGTIDPITGVPYNIESQTDPNSGVPFYYEQGASASGAAGGTGTTTTLTTNADPYRTQKQQAITAWQSKTGQTWSGPAGSYPAGWIAGGNVAGAATLISPGNVRWVVPLDPAINYATGWGVGSGGMAMDTYGRPTYVPWPYSRAVR